MNPIAALALVLLFVGLSIILACGVEIALRTAGIDVRDPIRDAFGPPKRKGR